MDKPKLKKEQVKTLLDNRYLSVLDLQYENTGHYYSATRRKADGTAAVLSDEDFRAMRPDAVTCVVIVRDKDGEYGLLLTKEFRYPVGQYLLSPPAGLLDSRDLSEDQPVLSAARREIEEETGLRLTENDKLFLISPLFFSTPGMTDESNAMACAVADLPEGFVFNSEGTESAEMIGDYVVYGKEEAEQMLRRCTDRDGIFFSVFTWAAMMYFVSGMWKEKL